jgi:hypothetical protein
VAWASRWSGQQFRFRGKKCAPKSALQRLQRRRLDVQPIAARMAKRKFWRKNDEPLKLEQALCLMDHLGGAVASLRGSSTAASTGASAETSGGHGLHYEDRRQVPHCKLPLLVQEQDPDLIEGCEAARIRAVQGVQATAVEQDSASTASPRKFDKCRPSGSINTHRVPCRISDDGAHRRRERRVEFSTVENSRAAPHGDGRWE